MSEVRSLADQYWAYFRSTEQLWNIERGDVDQIELWEDFSPEGVSSRIRHLEDMAETAERLSLSSGNPDDGFDAVTLATISFSARATAASLPWLRDRALLSAPTGFASYLPVLVPKYPLVTRSHGDGYVAKLAAFGAFVDGWIDGIREGVAAGRVPTEHGVIGSIAGYDKMITAKLADDPLAAQLPPTEASTGEVDAWRAAVQEVITLVVRPALSRLRDTLREEVLPHARPDEQAGICHLPGGVEAYAKLLWANTSTGHTPDQLHQLGLEVLARLDDEYRSTAGPVIGGDDPADLRRRLRNDVALRYRTSEEIVSDAETALARAQAVAPRWFTRLPAASCTAYAVDGGAGAYYSSPSPDGNRGGTFYFNTSDPTAWTRYSLEATTFHESIPGHHLQLALALELDLHPVHRELDIGSYVEGWGMYAERLADEMGLYSSPLQRVGMLALDSMRAGRLVVDTGIHAMGWSRQKALEFFFEATAQSRRIAEEEIDRYIGNPAQATSYMVGRLEIDSLRADSQRRLASRFDIRQFHDVILGGGMMPLDQLSHRVSTWAA